VVRTRILLPLPAVLVLAALVPAAAFAAGGTSPATAGAPTIAGGWGSNAFSYIGKYTLEPTGTTSTTSTNVTVPAAGVFSWAVRTAAQLSSAAGPVSSGALTTFVRKVKTGEPLAPSGILSIFGSSGSQVLYLTKMNLHGAQRTAVVNGGSFLGLPIGTFTATAGFRGSLDAVIKASGLGTVHVRLMNFVAAPPSARRS
jgi:hypothetical protein